MRFKQNILLCLLCFNTFSTFAQEEASAKMTWSDVHLSKQINNNFSAKVKLSYFNAFPHYASRFIDVGTSYEFKNNFTFGAYYRFQGNFETASQRFYIESSYKSINVKALGIKIEPRIRVQHRLRENEEGLDFHSYQVRSRMLLKKRLNCVHNTLLYSSIESFRSLTIDNKIPLERLRFDFGIRYDVPNTRHQIKITYRQQLDIDDQKKEVSGMFSTGYSFRF